MPDASWKLIGQQWVSTATPWSQESPEGTEVGAPKRRQCRSSSQRRPPVKEPNESERVGEPGTFAVSACRRLRQSRETQMVFQRAAGKRKRNRAFKSRHTCGSSW